MNASDPGYTATDLNGNSGTQTVTEGTDAIVGSATAGADAATRYLRRPVGSRPVLAGQTTAGCGMAETPDRLQSSMAFNDVIQHLATTDTVAIVTTRSSGNQTATPIWSMVVDGVPYVRSAFGDGSKWYQHALSGREVRFAMGDGKVAERDRAAALAQPSEAVRVEVVPASDAVQQSINDEVSTKYADQPSSAEPMFSDTAVGCTLRILDPGA